MSVNVSLASCRAVRRLSVWKRRNDVICWAKVQTWSISLVLLQLAEYSVMMPVCQGFDVPQRWLPQLLLRALTA